MVSRAYPGDFIQQAERRRVYFTLDMDKTVEENVAMLRAAYAIETTFAEAANDFDRKLDRVRAVISRGGIPKMDDTPAPTAAEALADLDKAVAGLHVTKMRETIKEVKQQLV